MADSYYTKFKNWLLEDIYSSDLNGSTIRVLLYIIRMTVGFQKDKDKLSISKICKDTMLSEMSVIRALKKLEADKWIRISRKKKKGSFYETNLITFLKVDRGSLKTDTGGSNKNDSNPLSELREYPSKGKESPLGVAFDTATQREKENILEEKEEEIEDNEYQFV